MNLGLNNKRALVTASTIGIGFAIARPLAAEEHCETDRWAIEPLGSALVGSDRLQGYRVELKSGD
jgi:NAD(P)-dependent dehydrogenase (short-subunit alcohol dehydrogenase family)